MIEQLVVRQWQIEDAEELQDVIVESHEHLKPFIPWVDDAAAMNMELHYRIAPHGCEIGYWVRVSEINKGIATLGTNLASGRVSEKLGYDLIGAKDREEWARND